jgi:hypothetical protein
MNKFNLDIEITATDNQATIKCYRLANTNKGKITMYNGAPQQVSCTIQRPTGSTEDTITITTRYRYGQFIEQPIIVSAT